MKSKEYLLLYPIILTLSVSLLLSCKKDEIKETENNNNNNGINNNFENCGVVVDASGNTYNTILIGHQCWFVENLKTVHFNDGSAIPHVADANEWSNLDVFTGNAYSWYNNNSSFGDTYGALYSLSVATSGMLCPEGWRVANDYDWSLLIEHLYTNGYNFSSGIPAYKGAKALASKSHWKTSNHVGAIGNNLSLNNRSGFTALPGGIRLGDGSFAYIEEQGYWWSIYYGTVGYLGSCRIMIYSNNSVVKVRSQSERVGLSARCIKN